jgi:riboflavin kinase/FMN adenylyltransferase
MILHTSISDFNEIHRALVTTGSFDGVHVGHKAIIRRLNQLVREIGENGYS